MAAGYFEFPAREDWRRIYSTSSFQKLFVLLDRFEVTENTVDGWGGLTKRIELRGYLYEMQHRLAAAARSYVLMMFYYEKGIPDQQWYISPGKDGEPIQYFPDFEEVDFHIKGWFNYYSDILYYKLFSAWDLVGHILNVKYDLKIKRADFDRAVKALGGKDKSLHTSLEGLRNSPAYRKAKKIRDDITHNYLPSTAGTTVYRGGQFEAIGLKGYVRSDEIVANVRDVIGLFEKTVQCLVASSSP